MREILFRGKRVDNGEWIYGDLTQHWGYRMLNYASGNMEDIAPDTVGQYTGLTDRHGEGVFEGDIIRDEDGDIYAVFYYEFYASYCAKRIAESSALFGLQDIDIYGAEVIGNIYDNPELLEWKGA